MKHKPWVSWPLLEPYLRPLIEAEGIDRVARLAHVDASGLGKLLNGRATLIGFEIADRLICFGLGDPGLWRRDPELERIYELS